MGDQDDEYRDQLHLLAVACLETSPELSADLIEQIQERARQLLPPKNMTVAKSLASAGDFVIDLLDQTPGVTGRQAAATIRAASDIGGDAALRVIARYGTDVREEVYNELIRAWSRWPDVAEYARVVLKDARLHGGRLSLTKELADCAAGLRYLRKLRFLSIETDIRSLDFIHPQSPLKELVLPVYVTEIDLSPLAHTALESLTLDIRSRDIPSVRGFGVPPAVVDLDPDASPALFDIDPIGDIATLRSLLITQCLMVKSLDPIWRLTGLLKLQLFQVGSKARFDTLRTLTEIKELTATEITNLHDLSAFQSFSAIRLLRLNDCKRLVDISQIIQWASSLTVLGLSGTGVVDLTPVRELTSLRALDLSNTDVQDLTPLADLPNLELVSLAGHRQAIDPAPIRRLQPIRLGRLGQGTFLIDPDKRFDLRRFFSRRGGDQYPEYADDRFLVPENYDNHAYARDMFETLRPYGLLRYL